MAKQSGCLKSRRNYNPVPTLCPRFLLPCSKNKYRCCTAYTPSHQNAISPPQTQRGILRLPEKDWIKSLLTIFCSGSPCQISRRNGCRQDKKHSQSRLWRAFFNAARACLCAESSTIKDCKQALSQIGHFTTQRKSVGIGDAQVHHLFNQPRVAAEVDHAVVGGACL